MKAYELGLYSGESGESIEVCPYDSVDLEFGDWMDGWKLGFYRVHNS